jgi:hypothetical protein
VLERVVDLARLAVHFPDGNSFDHID